MRYLYNMTSLSCVLWSPPNMKLFDCEEIFTQKVNLKTFFKAVVAALTQHWLLNQPKHTENFGIMLKRIQFTYKLVDICLNSVPCVVVTQNNPARP